MSALSDTQCILLKALIGNDEIYQHSIDTRNIVFDDNNHVIKIANHCLMPDDDERLCFDIEGLSQFPQLVSISLEETKIHGDIIHFRNLPHLVELNLSHTSVRGDVAHIMGLPKLTYCILQETNVDGNLHTFHTYRHTHSLEKCVIEL